MKKKVLALVCAMTLVFGGAMSVCAAGSVTADDVSQAVEEVKNEMPSGADVKVEADGSINVSVSGVSVSVSANEETRVQYAETAKSAVVTNVTNAAPNVEVKALDETQAKTPLAKIAAKLATVVANKEGLSSNKEVKSAATAFVADITASAAGTIAFDVAKVNAGSSAKIDTTAWLAGNQRVYALHFTGSGVERLDCQLVNGAITFTMNSFSPVAIVVEDLETVSDDGDDAPAADAGSSSSNGGAVSPKTADVSTAAAVVVIAMMSVAGLVVLKRRVRA